MILLTGAAGKTGRAVMQALAAKGVAVRAWVRRDMQGLEAQQLGAQEVVVGDVTETAVWQQATQNISAIYHICPNMHQREVEIGQMAIAAAQQNGVGHFVYHSVLHPQTEAMPHHWHKLRVEEALLASGIPCTILQPAAYMQNVLAGRRLIMEEGVFRVPYPVSTRLSLVDLQDVAEVAAKVLTEPGHGGAIYELVGEVEVTQTAVSTTLSKHLNRPVRAEEINLLTWQQQVIANGLDDYQIDTLLKMFQYYAQFNFEGNANVLRWLLNREPTSFTAFVKREFVRI